MKEFELGLDEYLKVSNKNILTFIHIIRELIIALSLIHDTGYVYNDLKVENIMMSVSHPMAK